MPFSEHGRIIELQTLNGMECGNILYSHNACNNIIEHVASCMTQEIVKQVISSKSKFSILVDESTSVSNVQSMIVYIRTEFDNQVCVYMLGLIPVEKETSAGLEQILVSYLNCVGLTDEIMKEQLIGFCSDGASCMTGVRNGLASGNIIKRQISTCQILSLHGPQIGTGSEKCC